MNSIYRNCVLVTGASGFIGHHLCNFLSAKGMNVIALSRNTTSNALVANTKVILDLRDSLEVRTLIGDIKPNYVVHLAAMKTRSIVPSDYRLAYEENLLSSFNLIEACHEFNTLKRFVFLGSCDEYGQQTPPFTENTRETPISSYGLSKLATTQLLLTFARAREFPAVILRPTVVYGPGQGTDMFLPALIQSVIRGDCFGMTKGEQTRDYVYVDDLVRAIDKALFASDSDVCGQLINVGSGIPIRVSELAYKVTRLIGDNAEQLLNFGAREYRQGEAMEYWANNDRAHELLNWQPLISLEDGLLRTIHSFQQVTC